MQPIRSVKNQYLGINAHLHSKLQNEGGWADFHARHIIHLADTLKARLRGMGYTVGVEESIQIKRISHTSEPESDVLIYDPASRQSTSGSQTAAVLEHPMTIAELLSPEPLSEKPFRSIVIYDVKAGQSGRGKPIAWIELLSPANKGDSDDAQIYRHKRLEVLAAGLVYIEIDYLHETPSTFPAISSYRTPRKRKANENARPYHIVLMDAREKFEKGPAWVNAFDVDEPIPTLTIPLSASDTITFDFGIPYTKTFEEGFLGDEVDYRQFPIKFDHYNTADQARIAARMLAVLKAYQAGIDLENGPFPVEVYNVEETISQVQSLIESV